MFDIFRFNGCFYCILNYFVSNFNVFGSRISYKYDAKNNKITIDVKLLNISIYTFCKLKKNFKFHKRNKLFFLYISI